MTPTELNAHADALISQGLAANPLKPCCSKGCSHCCYEPAFADQRQVDDMIESLTPAQIELVKARLPSWIEATVEFRKIQRPKATQYRDAKIPCPLLHAGLCMAYDKRPVDCRAFFAIGNPNDCAMPARAHQKFAGYSNEFMNAIWHRWISESDGLIVMDHIGALLAERLLGTKLESAGRLEAIKPEH